jgi:uncharacterized protein with ParB-like and HNH nuclease domain
MNFADIPKFPYSGYEVDVDYHGLLRWLGYQKEDGLDLNPDFQRGHVWTMEQRTRFIEYQLRGGEGGKVLCFNHPGWSGRNGGMHDGPYQILDGLQRLTSAVMFLKDELPVFGHLRSQIKGALRPVHAGFRWRVYELQNRKDVLQYYLDMNAGGTPHAEEEIARVRALLKDEDHG